MLKRCRAADKTPQDVAEKLWKQYGRGAERVASNRADAAQSEATATVYERAMEILGRWKRDGWEG